MNIGFDAKRAFLNRTGLGNYSRLLLTGLSQQFDNHHYYLYSPKLPYNDLTAGLYQLPGVQLRSAPWYLPDSIWRSRFITPQAKNDKLTIYHGLSNELPIGMTGSGIKQVVTIHDLIFLRYPALYPATDRKVYEAKTKYACKQADRIIAVSQQTKNDLISFLGIPEEKIFVHYQACSEVFLHPCTKQQLDAVIKKYQLPATYLLQVGTIETRKNLLLSLQALSALPEEVHLVAVGKRTSYLNELESYIQQNRLGKRVKILSEVPFADLPAIYQAATVFLYPSRFEGFGIPILEALNSGLPVIAATGSCLQEAGGPGSIYVAPDDAQQMADALTELLNNKEKTAQRIQLGLEYAQKFTLDKLSKELMRFYNELAKT